MLTDDEVFGTLRQTLSEVRMERPVETIMQRGIARRRSRNRAAVATAGLAAVASLALTLSLLTHTTTAAPTAAGAGAENAGPQTAQQFLLAAASKTEREPATTGRYWRARWLMHEGGQPSWQLVEFWHATRPGDATWQGQLRYQDGKALEPASLVKQGPEGFGAEREFSLAEVRALPSDPTMLRAVLNRKAREIGIDANHLTADGIDGYAFEATVGLLARSPATPAQRAAGYRLLATLPMVRIDGTATDALGRRGMLVLYAGTSRKQKVIIGADSHEVLAIIKVTKASRPADTTTPSGPDASSNVPRPASVQMLTTIRQWTDQEPVPPTVP